MHLALISKKGEIGNNNNVFIRKSLRKEIIVRPTLRNKFNKSCTSVNWQIYKKQMKKFVTTQKMHKNKQAIL